MKSVETATSHAEGLADAIGERAKSYIGGGVDALSAASGKARQIGRSANGYVRDNPWLAIGAAAGVGIVIGYLLRSRREY